MNPLRGLMALLRDRTPHLERLPEVVRAAHRPWYEIETRLSKHRAQRKARTRMARASRQRNRRAA